MNLDLSKVYGPPFADGTQFGVDLHVERYSVMGTDGTTTLALSDTTHLICTLSCAGQHHDPRFWFEQPTAARPGWLRTTCRECKRFMGYRPDDGKKGPNT